MKKSNIKEKRINIRVSNDEYDILSSKAKTAHVSVSTFLREVGLKGEITCLNNGKEIAQQIGTLHGKIEMYHQDMTDKIDKVKTTLESNNKIFRDSWGMLGTNSTDIKNMLHYQQVQVDAILNTLRYTYEEHEKDIEFKLQKVLSCIGG